VAPATTFPPPDPFEERVATYPTIPETVTSAAASAAATLTTRRDGLPTIGRAALSRPAASMRSPRRRSRNSMSVFT
jgi:hypothetical protein